MSRHRFFRSKTYSFDEVESSDDVSSQTTVVPLSPVSSSYIYDPKKSSLSLSSFVLNDRNTEQTLQTFEERKEDVWHVGDVCEALYEFDGDWYEGKIKRIGAGEILVEYVGYNDEAWLGLKEIKPEKKIESAAYYASVRPVATRTKSAPHPSLVKAKTTSMIRTPEKDNNKKRNVDTPPYQPQRKRQPPVLKKAQSAPLRISTNASTPQKTLIEVPLPDDKVEEEEEEVQPVKVRTRNSVKKRLTLVVVGHVDAGKSTLMGHLLYSLDVVTKKTMRKFEKLSKELGKASFKYAWVLDENEEERERGVTMEVASRDFETKNTLVTLLDSPGHKDFVRSVRDHHALSM